MLLICVFGTHEAALFISVGSGFPNEANLWYKIEFIKYKNIRYSPKHVCEPYKTSKKQERIVSIQTSDRNPLRVIVPWAVVSAALA